MLKYGRKLLLILSQTSKFHPLKLGKGEVISLHIFSGACDHLFMLEFELTYVSESIPVAPFTNMV